MFKLCSHAAFIPPPWSSLYICRKFHSTPALFASVKTCHYEILGVSKSASTDDIKKAYLQKAREHHPDLNKDKPNANQKFIEISKAYEILKDSSSRTQYDYEIRHTTQEQHFYRRYPSPGASYSGNPNRRNSMFVEMEYPPEDEDLFEDEEEVEFMDEDGSRMHFDEEFHVDLSNLFRMAGVRMGGGGVHGSFRINTKFTGGMPNFNMHNVMDALHRHQMRQKQKRKNMQQKQQTQRQRQQQQTQQRQGPNNTKQQNKKYNGEDGEERARGAKKRSNDAQTWYSFSQQGKPPPNDKNNKPKFTADTIFGDSKKSERMSKQERKWWEKTSKMFNNKKKR